METHYHTCRGCGDVVACPGSGEAFGRLDSGCFDGYCDDCTAALDAAEASSGARS